MKSKSPREPQRKAPSPKARLMWHDPSWNTLFDEPFAYVHGKRKVKRVALPDVVPVFVLDASPEAQEAMVEAATKPAKVMSKAFFKDSISEQPVKGIKEYAFELGFHHGARFALQQTGLLSAPSSPKRGRGKK